MSRARPRPLWPTAAGLVAVAATLIAAATAGGTGPVHAPHTHAADAAPGLVTAASAFTLAVSWPALRVALRPERRRMAWRSLLAATAGALALAVPLCWAHPVDGFDAHLWAMARFELLAGVGPGLLVYAVHATEGAGRSAPPPHRARSRLPEAVSGALAWTVTTYAWHLPPLLVPAGPAAQTVRDLCWIVSGVLLWRPALAPGEPRRGPLMAAHLAAVPLGLAMLLNGHTGAGLLMLTADAAMAACLLRGPLGLRTLRVVARPSLTRARTGQKGVRCARKKTNGSPEPDLAPRPGNGCAATGSPSPSVRSSTAYDPWWLPR